MRLVTVRAPQGHGQQVAAIAFQANVTQVSYQEAKTLHANNHRKQEAVQGRRSKLGKFNWGLHEQTNT